MRINGYKGRCRSVRGGVSANQQAMLAKTLQSLALSGIFVKPEEGQKLTNTFGFKLEVKDITEMQGDKSDKSQADHKNKNKGVIP